MNIPVHYLPGMLCQAFLKTPQVVSVHNFHQTTEGWTTVIKCMLTGIEYRLDLTPIKSEVKVGLMYSDFERGIK